VKLSNSIRERFHKMIRLVVTELFVIGNVSRFVLIGRLLIVLSGLKPLPCGLLQMSRSLGRWRRLLGLLPSTEKTSWAG
jgi:hypothetical protein